MKRSWAYSYKTSDGLRHEGFLEAETKDAVYQSLRKMGIRPIRVDECNAHPVAVNGLLHRSLVVAAIVLTGLIFLIVLVLQRRDSAPSDAAENKQVLVPSADSADSNSHTGKRTATIKSPSPEYVALAKRSEIMRERHRAAEAMIDRTLLSDCEPEMTPERKAVFKREIAKGRSIVALSRKNLKKDFYPMYRKISQSAQHEQYEAQRIYGSLMEEIDATEEWLDAVENFFKLVVDNEGKNML